MTPRDLVAAALAEHAIIPYDPNRTKFSPDDGLEVQCKCGVWVDCDVAGVTKHQATAVLAGLRGADEYEQPNDALVVESLDPNCLMLLIEGAAAAVVERLGDDGPPEHLGTVRLYRNSVGTPMVEVSEMDTPSGSVRFMLASVKKIVVL